jgi:hypothetical protein
LPYNKIAMSKNSEEGTEKQKAVMIGALEANAGNVREACKIAVITPQTHYRWRKEDSDYDEDVIRMKNICNFHIQEALILEAFNRISKGSDSVLNQMLRIYLKKVPDIMERVSLMMDTPKLELKFKYLHSREEAEKVRQEREGGEADMK